MFDLYARQKKQERKTNFSSIISRKNKIINCCLKILAHCILKVFYLQKLGLWRTDNKIQI